ncbi:hypothetical protein [Bacillus sp. B15-48]|nr:hypothetical protein [Bacillus sp. B15-48]
MGYFRFLFTVFAVAIGMSDKTAASDLSKSFTGDKKYWTSNM